MPPGNAPVRIGGDANVFSANADAGTLFVKVDFDTGSDFYAFAEAKRHKRKPPKKKYLQNTSLF